VEEKTPHWGWLYAAVMKERTPYKVVTDVVGSHSDVTVISASQRLYYL
jgi:hypothetical protein